MNDDPNGAGFSSGSYALRYDNQIDDPHEVTGMLHAMMPADVRVLDVGCGTGSVTLIVNSGRRNTVVAIEPNSDRAAKARSRGIDTHNCVLDENFVCSNGQFDVVMSSDVIEHTEDPAVFLSLVRGVLKDGGTLLISAPNVAHWSVRANLLLGRFDYQPTGIMDETHLRWFTESTFRKLLASCGFEILEFRHSAGMELSVYCHGKLRHVPRRLREYLIRSGVRAFPRLFGAQHIVKARKCTKPYLRPFS
jgi:SAM-dependent methyltransferase